jgi:hypothetical protein
MYSDFFNPDRSWITAGKRRGGEVGKEDYKKMTSMLHWLGS